MVYYTASLKKLFPSILVRIIEHSQHFEMFMDSTGFAHCGRNRSSKKFGGRLSGLCALIASSLLWIIFFEICSVLTLRFTFLISMSAFSDYRAKHSCSSTRAIHSLVFVYATFVNSSNSFLSISTSLLQDSC